MRMRPSSIRFAHASTSEGEPGRTSADLSISHPDSSVTTTPDASRRDRRGPRSAQRTAEGRSWTPASKDEASWWSRRRRYSVRESFKRAACASMRARSSMEMSRIRGNRLRPSKTPASSVFPALSNDSEKRLLALAREKRAAAVDAERQRDLARRAAQDAQRRADAARAAELQRNQERVRGEQAAFLDLMRRAGNPGLGRFPGRVMFSQTRGWKFGEYLLDRKGRWWRFRAVPAASGGAARYYAEALPAPPSVTSEQFAEMLAHYGVV